MTLLEQVDVTLIKTFLTFPILEDNPKSLAYSKGTLGSPLPFSSFTSAPLYACSCLRAFALAKPYA